jgi:hypothetical protein
MFLFEISTDPLITKLITVVDQLKTDLEKDKNNKPETVDEFLSYLQKYDITLDQNDLFDMIKKPPLKNIIHNIKNKKIIFKGYEEPEIPEKYSDNIVKSMAKKAAKNR